MKTEKITLVALVLSTLLLSACKKGEEKKGEIPACIEAEIERIKSEDVWNPPAQIWQYKYNGQTVYYIPQRCCDIPSTLLDENCNIICRPDGGLHGNGDGSCTDFFDKRTDEKLLWIDERTNNKLLENTEWKTNYLFCFDEAIEQYEFTVKSDAATIEFDWGYFVAFSDKGTYRSYYHAMCGNDCFKTVYGKYVVISDNYMYVAVDSVHYWGWCTPSYTDSTWTEIKDNKKIFFNISKTENVMTLTKNNNL